MLLAKLSLLVRGKGWIDHWVSLPIRLVDEDGAEEKEKDYWARVSTSVKDKFPPHDTHVVSEPDWPRKSGFSSTFVWTSL